MSKLNKLSKLVGSKTKETWHYDKVNQVVVDSTGEVVCKPKDSETADLIVNMRNSVLDLIEASESLLVCSIALKLENGTATPLIRAEAALECLGISAKLTSLIPKKVIKENQSAPEVKRNRKIF